MAEELCYLCALRSKDRGFQDRKSPVCVFLLCAFLNKRRGKVNSLLMVRVRCSAMYIDSYTAVIGLFLEAIGEHASICIVIICVDSLLLSRG